MGDCSESLWAAPAKALRMAALVIPAAELTRDQIVEEYVKDWVDKERERSLEGGWRRLLPCRDGKERYLPMLGAKASRSDSAIRCRD